VQDILEGAFLKHLEASAETIFIVVNKNSPVKTTFNTLAFAITHFFMANILIFHEPPAQTYLFT